MSYEALTRELAKLGAAASKPCSELCQEQHDEDERAGIPRVYKCVKQAEAEEALAAPAHEYAAVALALIRRMGGYDVNEGHWDLCTTVLYSPDKSCDCGKDALDALQAAMT